MLTALATLVLAASLEVGDTAPDFTVKDTDGNTLTLSKLVERGTVVLAFFPKAFTSGCTQEMKNLRDRFSDLEGVGATVIAVSTDDVETQKRFKQELAAPFHFVADQQAKLVDLYDVKTPVVSYAKRRTFVIGKDRRVSAIQEGSDAIDLTGTLKACGL